MKKLGEYGFIDETHGILTIQQIQTICTNVFRNFDIEYCYLFGSYAKGTANENSDIDLLIEKGKPLSLLKLSGFRQDVQAAMNLSVDVVTTTGIAPDFMEAIAGTEVLLYEE